MMIGLNVDHLLREIQVVVQIADRSFHAISCRIVEVIITRIEENGLDGSTIVDMLSNLEKLKEARVNSLARMSRDKVKLYK